MAKERTDLSDLVAQRRARLGLSLRDAADLCIDPETGIVEWKFGQLSRLEKGEPVIPPQLPQLRALAAGLRMELEDLQLAAGKQFFGIDVVEVQEVQGRAFVPDFDLLSPEDQEKVRLLVRAWADPNKRT